MKKIITLLTCLVVAVATSAQTIDFDKKLKDLGIELSAASKPVANYVKAVRTGNLLYLSVVKSFPTFPVMLVPSAFVGP